MYRIIKITDENGISNFHVQKKRKFLFIFPYWDTIQEGSDMSGWDDKKFISEDRAEKYIISLRKVKSKTSERIISVWN